MCFARQPAEGRVVFKSFALLIRRLLALLIEPLARVVPLRRGLVLGIKVRRRRSRLSLLGRVRVAVQVLLRSGPTSFFPARLAILLSLLLRVWAGNI